MESSDSMAFCRVTNIWEHGRQLATLTQDGTTWNFTYNADGIRTKRTTCAACTGSTTCEACGEGTSNATTYSYVYNGSSLSQMTAGNHQLNFFYDANGAPMVVIYNNVVYYYVTNLQGDVIAILDSTGTAVVEYTYDAWGKLLATSDSTETGLGTKNPLRYRGYVYDHETALYYLQSRYYDPELGRFINADAFASTGQGILGNNMFAYCLNNPAQYSDGTGNYARTANPNANCYEAHPAGGGGGIPIIPSPFRTLSDRLEKIANDIKTWVEAQKGLEEYGDNSIYVLRDPYDHYLVKYVGRTNNPARRQWEHQNDLSHPWRKNYQMVVILTGLTKEKAMLYEQIFISVYTVSYLENARREIAVRNVSKYQSYMGAATEIFTGIPVDAISDFITWR